jgi:hypothetical protein
LANTNITQHVAGFFTVTGVSNAIFVFDHGGTSTTALSASDCLVEIVGSASVAIASSTVTAGVISIHG